VHQGKKLIGEKRLTVEGQTGRSARPTNPHDAPPLAVAPFDAAMAKKHQKAWADHLGVPVEKDVDIGGGVKITMVLIARWQKHRLVDAEATVLPSRHVLDDFWFDLLLGQIQREDRFLPSDHESLQIELRELQKIALRADERPPSHETHKAGVM